MDFISWNTLKLLIGYQVEALASWAESGESYYDTKRIGKGAGDVAQSR